MRWFLLFSWTLLGSLPAVMAQPVFEDNFLNETGHSLAPVALDWKGYWGPSAKEYSEGAGAVAVLPVQAGVGSDGSSPGYIRFNFPQRDDTKGDIALVRGDLCVEAKGTTISWHAVAPVTFTRLRLLVQVEGNRWYITKAEWTPRNDGLDWAGIYPEDSLMEFDFTPEAKAWNEFTLVPDTEMTIGQEAPTALPTTKITGIGWYVSNLSTKEGTSVFLDTLQVQKP